MTQTTLPSDSLTNYLTVAIPPTQKDLPFDDGKNMETFRHKLQMDILIETLYPWLEQRDNGFVGGNMFLYFSMVQVRNKDYQGPDFFVVLDVPKGERLSWVVWEEGKAPDVIIELLSPSTAAKDKLVKKLTYQNQVRVPEYFWFDPFNSDDLAGFRLDINTYQPILSDSQDRLVSQQLQLALVKWYGLYYGVNATWLRWETLAGELLPTGQENAVNAQIKAQEAQAKANEAENKANEAQAKANEAQAKANEAQAKANEAENKANEAENKALEAEVKANEAQTKANEAEVKVEEVQIQVREMEQRSQDLENLLQQYKEKFGELL